MTTTLADRNYVDEALSALDQCNTDADLVNWDDRFTNNERYINLSDKLISELEGAYDKRVRAISKGED